MMKDHRNSWNRKGGVGSTMLTGHFCFIAAELGLSVAGASVGGPGDLRHWLRPAKIPCFDARRETSSRRTSTSSCSTCTRRRTTTRCSAPTSGSSPSTSVEADRRAVALASQLVGNVRRVRNFRHLECEVSDELESTDVIIPRCQSLAATDGSFRAAWATPLGALSAGARAVRELAAEVFCRVGLLPTPGTPSVNHEPEPEVPEPDAMKRLSSFFEALAAARAAEVHAPKPAMNEWARKLK
jgi:hypothetical protein